MITSEQLGTVIDCSTPQCVTRRTQLRVNSFWLTPGPGFLDTEKLSDTLTSSTSVMPTEAQSTQFKQYRARLLKKMKTTWIQGVLEPSLQGKELIDLKMEYLPNTSDHLQESIAGEQGSSWQTLSPGTKMIEVFDRSGGTLVILGESGSGKTTMLLDLARDLFARAEQNTTHPLPVVFNLSSWKKNKIIRGKLFQQSIADWLVNELHTRYAVPRRTGRTWVSTGQIMLLLDGLDELWQSEQGEGVQAINDYLQELGNQRKYLVICCRWGEYISLPVQVEFRGAVLLHPLTLEQVDQHFASAGQAFAGISEVLRKDTIFQKLVQSPLMLSLITLVYQGRSGHDLPVFNSVPEWREHLLSTYVERMLQHWRGYRRYSHRGGLRRLASIAREVRSDRSEFSLREILPGLPWPHDLAKLAWGLGVVVVIGLVYSLFAGLHALVHAGLILTLIYALVFGLTLELFEGLLLTIPVGIFVLLNYGWFVGLSFALGVALWGRFPSRPGRYTILRWSYKRILRHATRHRLLWKVGKRYLFVHRLLQDYLAALEV